MRMAAVYTPLRLEHCHIPHASRLQLNCDSTLLFKSHFAKMMASIFLYTSLDRNARVQAQMLQQISERIGLFLWVCSH